MSATADSRGLKRVCVGCGIRFYDMNKRPITCPGCGAEFTSEIKMKTRRGRAAAVETAVEKAAPANDQFEEVEQTADTVSLEEVEEGTDDVSEDDIDLEGGDLESLEDIDEDLDEEDIEVDVEKE